MRHKCATCCSPITSNRIVRFSYSFLLINYKVLANDIFYFYIDMLRIYGPQHDASQCGATCRGHIASNRVMRFCYSFLLTNKESIRERHFLFLHRYGASLRTATRCSATLRSIELQKSCQADSSVTVRSLPCRWTFRRLQELDYLRSSSFVF
jgi:hypothetical protein